MATKDKPGIAMPAATRRHFAKVAFLNGWVNDWGRLGRGLAVEAHRTSARIAAGLVLDGARLDHTSVAVRRLVAMAAVDHRLRNPRSRGDNHWIFEFASEDVPSGSMSVTTRRIARVLCRYCRAVLIADAIDEAGVRYGKWQRDQRIDTATRDHVVGCAVSYLAGGRP